MCHLIPLMGLSGSRSSLRCLEGEDGLGEVVGFFDYLKEIKAKVSHRTGMHVHVDGSGLEPEDVKEVQRAFTTYEAAFYGLNGEHYQERLQNPYCVPV